MAFNGELNFVGAVMRGFMRHRLHPFCLRLQSAHPIGGHQALAGRAGAYSASSCPPPDTRLWEDTSPLLDPDNLGTFTVITGDSSGVSADIHDRMPVWLTASQADEWLAAEPDDAMAMLLASEPPAMEAYRVCRAVNTLRNNREELLLQVE